MSAYHGKNVLSSIRPENKEEVLVYIKTKREHINFIIKILETHSHLVIPVQLDPQKGYVGLHTPKDCLHELLIILENIPRPLVIIKE